MTGKRAFQIVFLVMLISSVATAPCLIKPAVAEPPGSSQSERPQTPEEDTGPVVRLTPSGQQKGGIAVAAIQPLVHQNERRANGSVLLLQDLADLRGRYLEAEASMNADLTRLQASEKEYRRLKRLNTENRNVSDKSFQAAEAAWQVDGVRAQASGQALAALKSSVRLDWGDVIATWLFEGSAQFSQLMNNAKVLIRITLPRGTTITPMPETIEVVGASGHRISAEWVSLSPTTDPRIQGISFYYTASPVEGNLPAGINVAISIPVGAPQAGYLIPGAAIVWWQGSPWVYVQKSGEAFVRRRIPINIPLKDGYFVVHGFRGPEKIVVTGAQMLLSEEFQGRGRGGEEED